MNSDIKWFVGLILVIALLGFGVYRARHLSPETTQEPQTSGPLEQGAFPTHGTDVPYYPMQTYQEPTYGTPTYYSAPSSQTQNEQTQTYTQTQPSEDPAAPAPIATPIPNRIFITGITPSYEANSYGEYVTIQAAPENTSQMLITGMVLRGAVSRLSATIGQAWKLPFPNYGPGGEPVYLRPGETAYIITGRSGNGMSFALNRCTGYLAGNLNFNPALPMDCPLPIDEPLPAPPNQLSDACYEYLQSFGNCAVQSGEIPEHLQSDGNCQSHVFNKIGYNQCVTYHRNEPGFFRGEWYIYLNRDSRLWRSQRETIELLDTQGNLLATYGY